MGLSPSRISERSQKINNEIRRANNNQQSLIICALHDVCVVQNPEFAIHLKVPFELSTAACKAGLICPELFNMSVMLLYRLAALLKTQLIFYSLNILYNAEETMTVKKSF